MKTRYINCLKLNDQNELVKTDITISQGLICDNHGPVDQIIDMKNALVTPGLVDLHVHLREPGQTDKEDIVTGTQAAANGGYSHIYAMPNVQPVPDTKEKYQRIIEKIDEKALVKVTQIAPITKGITGNELVDFEQFPTRLFSNDGKGVQDAQTMYRAMKEIKRLDGICIAHTEDESLAQDGVMHQGTQSKNLNLKGFSDLSETTQIARDILLAEKTACHYHICHLSSAKSVQLVSLAQKERIKVSAEVTAHHLLLNESDVRLDSNYKMNPPLRSQQDQKALLVGLIDGTIACIASDHAPHTQSEKALGFEKAPFGIIGLDFTFPLLYTKLVKTKKLPLSVLVERMSDGPRALVGEKLELKPGYPADLSFFDLKQSFVLDESYIKSKSKNTPFLNERLYGPCVLCIVDGNVVMSKMNERKQA